MCGIIAVLSATDGREVPQSALIHGLIDQALASLDAGNANDAHQSLLRIDQLVHGPSGVEALISHPEMVSAIELAVTKVVEWVSLREQSLDVADLVGPELEAVNASLILLRDVTWSLRVDRLRTAREVAGLLGRSNNRAALDAFVNVQIALSALDRLEVRGRDSAGIQLFVHGHDLDLSEPAIAALLGQRRSMLFTSGAVEAPDGHLVFVYKAAAEIGELGDNTKALRAGIMGDELLHRALAGAKVRCTVLGHTRWASVGIISEPNAHPVNSIELESTGVMASAPYVAAVLNGDVDNHADLKALHGLQIAAEVTTDAKVIPALVARATANGVDPVEAFRRAVASFEGSVAIGAIASDNPERIMLALRGSGQALYVGVAPGSFIVASEPYGVIEETSTYLRLDGETPARAESPSTSRGQIVVLDGALAGSLAGLRRFAYDGTDLPVLDSELVTAEITTRDIDRGAFPHFLLKEITEAPRSFRTTLRGHLREIGGRWTSVLADSSLPAAVREELANGTIKRVLVIGQGTAAVAGQAMVGTLRELCRDELIVEAVTASELSGFGLAPDLSHTLIVAISQSGTTTDTNRTVDLARSRGARVLAIVNRRNSDLTDKVDGVLYTSDGRDVEMSVASTKAFYAQVAAGALLAAAICDAAGVGDMLKRSELLGALRELPDAMEKVIALRPQIAEAAHRFAPPRTYWAIVGNGPNKVAAEEVRIKLSELCYKSIACDVTEDKKHIDLSSEPMILVCAAGLSGSTADDVAKEVAIYRAHKAAPIVVATEGEERFNAALQVISVPVVHQQLAFILSAMVGHLFGYEAALAIDGQARVLREARSVIEDAITGSPSGDEMLDRLRGGLAAPAQKFFDILRTGALDGHLSPSAAVRVASMLRFGTGVVSLDAYQLEHGKVGTPSVMIEDLTAALTTAIEELTRPVDAIKHQAKTVTVGISRSDEALLHTPLVAALLAAGAPRDRLAYRTLKALADLDPAIVQVLGSTRYRIDGDIDADTATIEVIDRAGLGAELASRTGRDPHLKGTKRRVAAERSVWAAVGRSDGRTMVIVPEVKGNTATGITLLHVRFADKLDPMAARAVLQGYRDRYAQLHDQVTETEPVFRDDILGTLSVTELLTAPVQVLAEHWRA
jgi:glutamine---fructose-6-phosphate transaminase (isomerizing)